MQLSSTSTSSSKTRDFNRSSGSRVRKKHKRLDAICEKEYNRNHIGPNGADGGAGSKSDLRRSSRMRHAPVLLDVSPSPVKKRRRIDRNVGWSGDKIGKSSTPRGKVNDSEKISDVETSGSWRLRLRSRGRNAGGVREKGSSSSGKRRFFEEDKVDGGGLGERKEDLDGGKLMVVKSKRTGWVKALNDAGKGEREVEFHEVKEESESEGVNAAGNEDEEGEGEDFTPILESGMLCEDETEMVGDNQEDVVQEEERDVPSCLLVEEGFIDDKNGVKSDKASEELESGKEEEESESDKQVEELEPGEQMEESESSEQVEELEIGIQVKESGCGEQVKELESGKEGDNQQDLVVNGNATNEAEGGGDDVCLDKSEERPVEGVNVMMLDNLNRDPTNSVGKARIKQGRRCGLCGGGTDGKPPKRLVQDTLESEGEAYSGSSASEEPNYDIWDGFGDEPGWLGRLLGPINDRYGIAGIWVHQHCAVWSPEVYFAGLGCLKNVRAALCRGRALKCSRCGRPGATIGCRVDRCPKTYHLPCARANSCIFDHRKFLIACTDHRHLFQPYGNHYVTKIKKLKAKKMKLEMRKFSDEAWRKDIEAEEKWLEKCGEDEEFLKRESKRLHRDLLRVSPVYIGGPDSESGNIFEGWESVAGLQDVIRCMKEVVILPLLYPEFYDNLGLTPPRGVLLHGYPGTGKTLVVRALIGSCSRGDKRIAYFARKGADCLGKYVGDAERQLRLLFQVAEKCQPSIIFFDEIDGLAPVRTRQQDQTHSSVVSTLLSLLDGLKSRGSVVVIGATNRPEAVDPALRRPGRFDREIYFPLPSVEDRAAILSLHTQRWPKPVTGSFLNWIARRTVGFAGADLQALCTQAAIVALKRNFPLQDLLSAAEKKSPAANHIPLPVFAVEQRDWLEALSCSPPPCSRREAGMAANDLASSPLPTHLVPCLLQPLSTLLVSLYLDERLWLPLPLSKAAKMVESVIVSALDKKKLPNDSWWAQIDVFLQEADIAKEVERRLSCTGILMGEASVPGFDAFIDDTDYDSVMFEPSPKDNHSSCTNLLPNISFASRKKSGFRILIAGSARAGQRHLASCLLQCFVGNVEIQKVDLATVTQEGHGDVVQGMAQILMKCVSVGRCLLFMPRIDLWAVETCRHVNEANDLSSSNDQYSQKKESCFTDGHVVEEYLSCSKRCEMANIAEPQGAAQSASCAWSLFVEQVESICVSTSLMILATSEVPCPALPLKIKQFFESGLSNSSESTPFEHTVPRFSVEVGGNFNHDIVINHSAAKLSRDLVQPFVQLLHQRSHDRTVICKEYKTCDFIEGQTGMGHFSSNHQGSANELDHKTQCPDKSSTKVLPRSVNRTLKGKTSLLLAISTFGYQILRYPHFAELCWVTSKLKEGPSAEIGGQWKGWPFNTCIIRPSPSLDKVAVACSLGNIKNKENFGLVRGLTAVGLSAYRGMYTSLREVSFELRKVLELLVGEINVKIQAGKNRYRYVRVLSQVAYVDDLVSSWAYGLQSLELDAQRKVADPKFSTVGSLDDHHASFNKPVEIEGLQPNVSNKSHHESEGLLESPRRFAAEDIELIELSRGDDTSGFPIPETRVLDGSAQKIVLPGHVAADEHLHNSAAAIESVDKIMNQQGGTNYRPYDAKEAGSAVLDGYSEKGGYSNGLAVTDSVDPSLCSSGEVDCVKFSGSGTANNQNNGLSLSQNVSLCAASEVACMYNCCSECLNTLQSLIRKNLTNEWGLNHSHWTVEDVHNIVTSLSVDLLAAVRKLAESKSNSFDEDLRHENHGKLSVSSESSICHCTRSREGLVEPVECSGHNVGGCVSANGTTSMKTQFGLKFAFRDGVLVPVINSCKDVHCHCRFETLCLCLLIESIVMKKEPFD
ncbi:AAA domain-containing protein/zf-HC5HC2H domain-containing protein [Cephalotus follicularis]|uniref:AAA domain-containing protein/zf-HC5HC2H domain-containing protein n=1 Tax=Cephalotus follicularis TaxID=3775 RepID=A0A1Q3B7K6_CEPFO|nr:AAA domain-containing protein/zf-HC5HC2H domain-containing protein [Cephalotus follicularis]